jgi:DNA-binding MarR family transcriptional regulator
LAGKPRKTADTRSNNGAATRDSELGPTLEFMGILWSLNHALEVTSKRMESELGVTAQQRMMVRIIGKFPGITSGRVAELLRVHRATVSVTLNRLEARDIVKRKRDAGDARRVTLTLTARGRALDVSAKGTVESAVAHLLANAPEKNLAAARKTMEGLMTALEDAR